MAVFLLLALLWVVILLPPAVRARAARREAFILSLGQLPLPETPPPPPRSPRVQRRRQVAGGLLLAMAATLLIGLLPPFRALLVVHLFLVDSFLAYVALLAHMSNRAAKRRAADAEVPEQVAAPPSRVPAAPARHRREPRPPLLGELGPMAPAR